MKLKHDNAILWKRLRRRDTRLAEVSAELAAVQDGGNEQGIRALEFKGRGSIIPDSVRDLVNELVAIGLKNGQISAAISSIAEAVGVPVKGKISARTVSRIVDEGGVAAKMQAAELSMSAQSTLSHKLSATIYSLSFQTRPHSQW